MKFEINVLIKQSKANDRFAQKKLYDYTYRELAVVVALFTKNDSERDWIFNLGMLKVFNKLDHYSLNTNYLGWARTILKRTAIDNYRKNKVHIEKMDPTDFVENTYNLGYIEDAFSNMETEEIIQIIQQLPKKERIIFTMYEIEGYSHVEIEKEILVNRNTSKWLLAKSKKTLRKRLNIYLNLNKIAHEK